MKFDIIYADPPWEYKGQTQTGKAKFKGSTFRGGTTVKTGGAATHYNTMTLSDLKNLDMDSIAAKDCLLFMWVTNPHLDQGIDLLKTWGFKWATVGFVWDKQRVNPGFYTMSQCELCIIGKRGKIPQPRGARNVRQLVSNMRQEHSMKPAEVRTRIEQMFPEQSKVELFAREKVRGWCAWGDEVDSDVELRIKK